MNVSEKKNLEKKVKIVASHISFASCLFSDSSEIWMPRASENASAIAIVNMPPITTPFEWVPECKPIINPSVVIIPDVRPKLTPVFNECLIPSPIAALHSFLFFFKKLSKSCHHNNCLNYISCSITYN